MSPSPPDHILEFLASIGATKITHHAGRSLQDHLIATWQILTSWNCDEAVSIAGLCHSIYGTDAFDTACLGLSDRPKVQKEIGQAAEHYAYLFGAIFRDKFLADPASRTQNNRFDKSQIQIDDAARTAICNILLANELDLVIAKKGKGRPDKVAKKVGPIFKQLEPFVSKAGANAYYQLTTKSFE